MAKKKMIAIIPALNEEKTIDKILTQTKKYVDEVILVDDASTDNTAQIAREKGATIFSHKTNQGYDRSIDDGFKLAAKHGAHIIVTLDADGQHNPEEIPSIIAPIINNEADVVVGRRSRCSRISEYLFSLIGRIALGINDPICGFKAYHIRIYRQIGYFDKISSIGTELIFNAWKAGYRIVQRNITLRKREGIPRFGTDIEANWKIFKAICKILIKLIIEKLKRNENKF